ncbi:MAG: DUF3047 domain-containing protein [Rhodoferax sp.]|nr:DUF3047 domain-containing protein [Rhodoferax sp.]
MHRKVCCAGCSASRTGAVAEPATGPQPGSSAIYLIAMISILVWPGAVFGQNFVATPAPFFLTGPTRLDPAWRENGLPPDKAVPRTRFEPAALDGQTVLRIATDRSYGVLSHDGPAGGSLLSWRWRLERGLPQADITQRSGDDAALKVCLFFDQPMQDIPLLQRATLLLARRSTGQALPAATLCYLWDSRLQPGTSGHNPYTSRVRYLVLDGPASPPGQWVGHRRRVADDFARLFGAESAQTPPLLGLAVGADSDNTGGQSLAYIDALRWNP